MAGKTGRTLASTVASGLGGYEPEVAEYLKVTLDHKPEWAGHLVRVSRLHRSEGPELDARFLATVHVLTMGGETLSKFEVYKNLVVGIEGPPPWAE